VFAQRGFRLRQPEAGARSMDAPRQDQSKNKRQQQQDLHLLMGMPLQTIPAPAKDLMPVPEGHKSVPADRPILEALHHGALELNDPAALDADHMIVVRPVRLELVFGSAVHRADLRHNPAFLQELDGAEDGRPADGGVLFLEGHVDFIHLKVPIGRHEQAEDLLPLTGQLQTLPAQMLLEGLEDGRQPGLELLGPPGVSWEKDNLRSLHFLIETPNHSIEIESHYQVSRGPLSRKK